MAVLLYFNYIFQTSLTNMGLHFLTFYIDLIEQKGLKPLLERLKLLGGWPVLEGEKWQDENFDWKKSVFKFRKMGYSQNFFFELAVEIDSKDSDKRVLSVCYYLYDSI